MLVECERCKQVTECQFFGHPSDVETDKAQNGEWLCPPCVPLRNEELGEAISQLEKALRGF